MKQVTFVKEGYDPFIDFIKAYAIICVLIGHTFPMLDKLGYCFWGGMQVPLFILIQTFHFYKKDSKIHVGKIFKRIVVPFAAISGVIFLTKLLIYGYDYNSLIVNCITNGGGYGPGSYYPLVYIQVALLLVMFKPLFKRFDKQTLLWVFLAISESLEILCGYLNVPESLYRLLSFRYIFLLYLGWIWITDGVKVNSQTIILCIISFMAIAYFQYFSASIDNEPWFFDTRWKVHRWPCYFYVSHGLVFMLYYFWKRVKEKEWVFKTVKLLANASYEIFLIQMAVITLFGIDAIAFVSNNKVQLALWLVIVWSVSIFGGLYFHKIYNKLLDNKICTKRQLNS